MSGADDTRALLERLMQAISTGDPEAMSTMVHPECELKSLLGQVEGGVYRGPSGAREWYRDVIEAFDPFDPGHTATEDAGDALIARGHARGRARSSGIELEWDWAGLMRSRDGLVTRFAIYEDREELQRQEGLAQVGS